MDLLRPLALLVIALPLVGCASFNKQCFGNGVCRTEKGGVVTWEGPPEEVAKLQAKERAEKQAAGEADKAYAEAPRRGAGEPIRLVLIGPSTSNADLESLTSPYRNMMEQALSNDSRIQLVPYGQVKGFFEADSVSSFSTRKRQVSLDEPLVRKLRDSTDKIDVVLVAQIEPKKASGFVKGAGLTVAEVNNVEFTANLTSIYKFDEQTHSEVGKSTDSLNMAGIKDGKKGSVQMKGKRNTEQDRPAVADYAKWVRDTIHSQIAPNLPSLAAAADIRARLDAKRTELTKE